MKTIMFDLLKTMMMTVFEIRVTTARIGIITPELNIKYNV